MLCFATSSLGADLSLEAPRGLLYAVLRLSVSAGYSLWWASLRVAEARDKLEAHSIVKLVKGEKTNTIPQSVHTYIRNASILVGKGDFLDIEINHFFTSA